MASSAEPLRSYLSRGLKFGSFYSPEDSNALARVARRAAYQVSPGVVIDLGCGTAIPTIHACGRRHFGLGLDSDPESITVGRSNAMIMARDNIALVRADYLAATGRFAVVMSNPPYIPTANLDLDPRLEVLGDGTSAIGEILATYRPLSENFVLHFASIANPLRVLQLAHDYGVELEYLELTVAQFGSYTSVPSRLSHLLRCRREGTAYFVTDSDSSEFPQRFRQLLMTAHFKAGRSSRSSIYAHVVSTVLAILEAFQTGGIRCVSELHSSSREFGLRIVVLPNALDAAADSAESH